MPSQSSRFAFVIAAALSAAALAQDTAPDTLVKAVTEEVLQLIRQDKEIQAGNPAKIAGVVEARILPVFDFTRMTQLAAARSWPAASPEQQKALTQEFKTLLVRTYSTALSSYRDQEIRFKPLRASPGDTEVTVRSVVIQPGTVPLALDYDMAKTESGWKVYDVKIEGVSLITTYRETFAGIVRERGVDGLIRSLSDKNRDGEARQRMRQAGEFFDPAIQRKAAAG